MPGRPLIPEAVLRARGHTHPDLIRRREVQRETLAAFEARGPQLRAQAAENLARWRSERHGAQPVGHVEVIPGDWGAVALAQTRAHGSLFAVLNMANAHVPGGAYIEGTAAQEENLFRRTDAHFAVDDAQLVPSRERYTPEMTAQLSAAGGRVYLDVERPRTCIRGPEDRDRDDLGYPWLDATAVFPFLELRAAAMDLRGGGAYDHHEMRRRVRAQLDTLIEAGVRYTVLSAFGCGAFGNPAPRVAALYREEIARVADAFAVIAFAIFYPGYGPDNFTPFAQELATSTPDHRS